MRRPDHVATRHAGPAPQLRGQLVDDPHRRPRIAEDRRAHGDRRRPGSKERERVSAAADSAHAQDRHVRERGVHLVDATQRHRADRRPGKAPGDAGQRRAQRVGVDDHAEQGVDQREPVGAGGDDRVGDLHDVGDVRGELGEAPAAAPSPESSALTAPMTSDAAVAEQANTCPRSATFGQLMFTSTSEMPGACAKAPGELGVLSRRTRRRC